MERMKKKTQQPGGASVKNVTNAVVKKMNNHLKALPLKAEEAELKL
jgi:hypothetical protein